MEGKGNFSAIQIDQPSAPEPPVSFTDTLLNAYSVLHAGSPENTERLLASTDEPKELSPLLCVVVGKAEYISSRKLYFGFKVRHHNAEFRGEVRFTHTTGARGREAKRVLSPSVCATQLQSCPTLWDPMDSSLPDSSVHKVLQARILEWIAISYSRGSS